MSIKIKWKDLVENSARINNGRTEHDLSQESNLYWMIRRVEGQAIVSAKVLVDDGAEEAEVVVVLNDGAEKHFTCKIC